MRSAIRLMVGLVLVITAAVGIAVALTNPGAAPTRHEAR
jgi:hypothetical protein